MDFLIVSERALFRDLIASFCATEGIGILGLYATLSAVPAKIMCDNVILHIPESCSIKELGISEYRSRFSNSRIILIVSAAVPFEVTRELANKVDATIHDDRSLLTLSSFLTVVQEGFCISPNDDGVSRTRQHHLPGSRTPLAAKSPVTQGETRRITLDPATGSAPPIKDQHGAEIAWLAKLSPREKQVLHMLCEGNSNKNIANQLDIVESTVKVHLRGCFRKIGVKNRTQAAVWAAQHLPK